MDCSRVKAGEVEEEKSIIMRGEGKEVRKRMRRRRRRGRTNDI